MLQKDKIVELERFNRRKRLKKKKKFRGHIRFIRRIRHVIEFILFLFITLPLAALPLPIARKVGEGIGVMLYHIWGSRKRIALKNISDALERDQLRTELSAKEIYKESLCNLGRSIAEINKIYYGLADELVRSVKVSGHEDFKAAEAKGKGVIVFSGHCGNWELMLAFSDRGTNVHGVAREQNNPYINDFILRARERFGGKIVYKEGGLRTFLRVLRDKGTVGVVVDQAVRPSEGVLIDFLGSPAWTSKMPASIAKRTGAPVVPIFIRRVGDGHEMTLYPELQLTGDDVRDTKILSACVEEYIRENPTQWLWIHRRWKKTDGLSLSDVSPEGR